MTFAWGSLPWGDIISGAVQVGGSMYGAKQAKKGARQAGRAATPIPYGTSSQWGTTTVDPRTRQIGLQQAQNPFAQMFNVGGIQSLANAFSAPGAAYYGAAPEIAEAARGMYGPELDTAMQERLGLMRQLAQPEEQRQATQLNDRLFAMGRLGGTGGGIEQEALARAQSAADLQRQLASADWAQNRAMNRFNTAQQAVGAGMGAQQQQFGMGQQSLSGLGNLFQMLLNQANVGVGSAAGMPAGLAAQANAPLSNQWLTGLKESGAFDALSNQLNKWLGTGQPTSPTPAAAQAAGQPGPYQSGYVMPRAPNSTLAGFGV